MKILIGIFSLLTINFASAFEPTTSEILIHKSLRLESQILPVDKKEVKTFSDVARQHPTATLVVSIDTNNDDIPESYVFSPGKYDSCDFTVKNTDCNGLITADSKEKKFSETLVTKIWDPQSGLPTSKKIRMSTINSQTSVSAYNGSISIDTFEEMIIDKINPAKLNYETFTIEFKDPSDDLKDSLRKGWDGSIKGYSTAKKGYDYYQQHSTIRKGWDGSIKGSKITVTINLGKAILGTLVLQGVSDPGRLEECASVNVCNDKLDSILNLIR